MATLHTHNRVGFLNLNQSMDHPLQTESYAILSKDAADLGTDVITDINAKSDKVLREDERKGWPSRTECGKWSENEPTLVRFNCMFQLEKLR